MWTSPKLCILRNERALHGDQQNLEDLEDQLTRDEDDSNSLALAVRTPSYLYTDLQLLTFDDPNLPFCSNGPHNKEVKGDPSGSFIPVFSQLAVKLHIHTRPRPVAAVVVPDSFFEDRAFVILFSDHNSLLLGPR